MPIAHASLYTDMLEMTRREHMMVEDDARVVLDPDIAAFIAAAIPEIETATTEELGDMLSGGTALCARLKLDFVIDCPALAEKVQLLAARETRVRALGHDLGITAWSFMEPLAGATAEPFTARASGIARMWTADEGISTETSTRLRSAMAPPDTGRAALVQNVGTALNELVKGEAAADIPDTREQTAAIWRYRFGGVRWLRDLRPDLPPPPPKETEDASGTDHEWETSRWPAVENALLAVFDDLESSMNDVALQPGEVVMIDFADEEFTGLPENIRYWAYLEETKDGKRTGDIGLMFVNAIDSVGPSLCGEGNVDEHACVPMLAGGYGPEPDNDRSTGLCNYPLMRDGYLCQPISTDDERHCKESVATDGATVITTCTSTDEPRETDAGGDAGKDGLWIRATDNQTPNADVCTPNRSTSYLNTIGNTMLFLNRCWLQSLADHRLIPGRAPLGTGETAFPYDVCLREDPRLGSLLRGPQQLAWLPPPYRPELLVQHIEETLCPGYPPGDPLCPFPLERRLDIPVTELLSLGTDLIDQPQEYDEESRMVQAFNDAIGARVANRLYSEYIGQRVTTLTELLNAAAGDLQEFTKATFADQLCSLNMADEKSFLESASCGLPEDEETRSSSSSGGAISSTTNSRAASSISSVVTSQPSSRSSSSDPFAIDDDFFLEIVTAP
jgi:hypothetical protein